MEVTVFHYLWDLSEEIEAQGGHNNSFSLLPSENLAVALPVSVHNDVHINSKFLVIIFYLGESAAVCGHQTWQDQVLQQLQYDCHLLLLIIPMDFQVSFLPVFSSVNTTTR